MLHHTPTPNAAHGDSALLVSWGRETMSALILHDVDEVLMRALEQRAARHGRSLEAEHQAILRSVLLGAETVMDFKQFLASMPDVGEDDELCPPRGPERQVPI